MRGGRGAFLARKTGPALKGKRPHESSAGVPEGVEAGRPPHPPGSGELAPFRARSPPLPSAFWARVWVGGVGKVGVDHKCGTQVLQPQDGRGPAIKGGARLPGARSSPGRLRRKVWDRGEGELCTQVAQRVRGQSDWPREAGRSGREEGGKGAGRPSPSDSPGRCGAWPAWTAPGIP